MTIIMQCMTRGGMNVEIVSTTSNVKHVNVFPPWNTWNYIITTWNTVDQD